MSIKISTTDFFRFLWKWFFFLTLWYFAKDRKSSSSHEIRFILPQFPSSLLSSHLNVHDDYAEIFLSSDIPKDTRWLTASLAYVRNLRLFIITKKNSSRYHGFIWISERNFSKDLEFSCHAVGRRENNRYVYRDDRYIFPYLRHRRLNYSMLLSPA